MQMLSQGRKIVSMHAVTFTELAVARCVALAASSKMFCA